MKQQLSKSFFVIMLFGFSPIFSGDVSRIKGLKSPSSAVLQSIDVNRLSDMLLDDEDGEFDMHLPSPKEVNDVIFSGTHKDAWSGDWSVRYKAFRRSPDSRERSNSWKFEEWKKIATIVALACDESSFEREDAIDVAAHAKKIALQFDDKEN